MADSDKFITRGVRSMFLSTAFFFVANVFVKEVSHLPAMEAVFFRCTIASVLCLIGLHRAKASVIGSNHLILALRGIFGTIALFTFFVTLHNIPLATAQTLQYVSPIFSAVLAIVILREKLGRTQWLFYAIAFAGVLLIQRVDHRVEPFYVMLGVLSAFCSGMAYNLVRRMSGQEHRLTIVFHFQLVGAIAGFIAILFEWVQPTGWDWLWLLGLGVFSQLGQIYLTDALQREKVAGVAIVIYSGLVYAVVIGWTIFGEAQSLLSLAGMLLVVAGVLASVFNSRRLERRVEDVEATAA
ncbi:MAG: DMT family transporter [Acidobacteria bacterium]|nr:DMT family transporter [Acidobacteriota bacterium]